MKEINAAIFAQLVYNNYYLIEKKDYSKSLGDFNTVSWKVVKPNYFDEEVIGKKEKREINYLYDLSLWNGLNKEW